MTTAITSLPRYAVTEIKVAYVPFGTYAGHRVVRVAFSGCNLWDGHPLRRGEEHPCGLWCDSVHQKGAVVDLEELVEKVNEVWGKGERGMPLVLFTGGEPALQVDEALVRALMRAGFHLGIETNGTVMIAPTVRSRLSFVILSPKRATEMTKLDLLKPTDVVVVLPGAMHAKEGWTDEELAALADRFEVLPAESKLHLTPQDPLTAQDPGMTLLRGHMPEDEAEADLADMAYRSYIGRVLEVVERDPRWRVAMPVGKFIGLP